MMSPTRLSIRSRLLPGPENYKPIHFQGGGTAPPLPENPPQAFRVNREEYFGALPMKGKTMQHKKTQLAPKHNGRPPLQEAVRLPFDTRGGRQSFVTDLRSIISAAHKLPAEVAPPARVWSSLRAQLERQGILSCSAKGRLEEHTRFPMFKN